VEGTRRVSDAQAHNAKWDAAKTELDQLNATKPGADLQLLIKTQRRSSRS